MPWSRAAPRPRRERRRRGLASWPSSNGCPSRATSTRDPRTSRRRRSSSAGAAPCSICTSGSASGCSPAATSTPARHRTRRRGGRRWRSWALAVEHPAGGTAARARRRPRGGPRPHSSGPALPPLGGDADPDPPPGESQEARWYGWDEAQDLADVALATRCRSRGPRSRRWCDRPARPPARRPGPRHLHHATPAPTPGLGRRARAHRRRGAAGHHSARSGPGPRPAGRARGRPGRAGGADRGRSRRGATASSPGSTRPPARRVATCRP